MVATKEKKEAQNPLILRCHRLMEAFAKCDDERDFYIDRLEGFLIFVDLDKPAEELELLEQELKNNHDRYCTIPKLSFYETKKIMESFVLEKVYDIDTKEKLLELIQSKEARENFLEFIYDHHTEQEKWQQFYVERSRIRIIEWLRQNHFHFVFEEDLELPRNVMEKLKHELFQTKVSKEIQQARKSLVLKAKTYYSNEALNPRPKRGRPPKQVVKPEIEPQVTMDIYTTIPIVVRPFLFAPDFHPTSMFLGFSSKINEDELLKKFGTPIDTNLNQKLASLRTLSDKLSKTADSSTLDFNIDDEDEEDEDEEEPKPKVTKSKKNGRAESKTTPSATKPKSTSTSKPKNTSKNSSAKTKSTSSSKTRTLKKIIKKPS